MDEAEAFASVARMQERAERDVAEAARGCGTNPAKRQKLREGKRKKLRAVRALRHLVERRYQPHVANRTRAASSRKPVSDRDIKMGCFWTNSAGERQIAALTGRAPRIALATKAARRVSSAAEKRTRENKKKGGTAAAAHYVRRHNKDISMF